MSVAIVQGAGGSIGRAVLRQILQRSASPDLQLVATSSSSPPDQLKSSLLEGLNLKQDHQDSLHTLKLDVKSEESVAAAAQEVEHRFGKDSLRLLFSASGLLKPDKSITKVNLADLEESFRLNVLGQILTYKHFVPLLPSAEVTFEEGEDALAGVLAPGMSVIAALTARIGSTTDNRKGGWVAYRSSKAALNSVIRTLDHELSLRRRNTSGKVLAIALHPGTVVDTNLSRAFTDKSQAGKKEGIETADVAAGKLLDVLKGLKDDQGGQFLDYAGRKIPW